MERNQPGKVDQAEDEDVDFVRDDGNLMYLDQLGGTD